MHSKAPIGLTHTKGVKRHSIAILERRSQHYSVLFLAIARIFAHSYRRRIKWFSKSKSNIKNVIQLIHSDHLIGFRVKIIKAFKHMFVQPIGFPEMTPYAKSKMIIVIG